MTCFALACGNVLTLRSDHRILDQNDADKRCWLDSGRWPQKRQLLSRANKEKDGFSRSWRMRWMHLQLRRKNSEGCRIFKDSTAKC